MTQSSREARKGTAEAHAPDGLNRHVPGSIHMCGRTASPLPCTHQAHNLRRGRGARRAGPAGRDVRNIDGRIDEQRGGQRLRQHTRRGHDADLPHARTRGVSRARVDDVMVQQARSLVRNIGVGSRMSITGTSGVPRRISVRVPSLSLVRSTPRGRHSAQHHQALSGRPSSACHPHRMFHAMFHARADQPQAPPHAPPRAPPQATAARSATGPAQTARASPSGPRLSPDVDRDAMPPAGSSTTPATDVGAP